MNCSVSVTREGVGTLIKETLGKMFGEEGSGEGHCCDREDSS